MSGADKFLAIALAIVAFLMLVVWLLTRPQPDVEDAYTNPVYAPYSGKGLATYDRTGPLPAVGQVDDADYVSRALGHVPCQATTCSHKPWPGQHCRTCDLPYPCPPSGPLNETRPHFDDDKAAFQRGWRETGRWDA